MDEPRVLELRKDKAAGLNAFRYIITLCETCHTLGAALEALGIIHNVASKALTDSDKAPVGVEIIDRPLTKEEVTQKWNEGGPCSPAKVKREGE